MTTPTAEEILCDPSWRRTELTRSEWLAQRLADALAEVERWAGYVKAEIAMRQTAERERDEARAKLAEREALWRELGRLEGLRYHDAHQEEDYRALCRKLGLDAEGEK